MSFRGDIQTIAAHVINVECFCIGNNGIINNGIKSTEIKILVADNDEGTCIRLINLPRTIIKLEEVLEICFEDIGS
jgi:hypothetical protein